MARYKKGYFLEDPIARILSGSACLACIAIKSGDIWNFSYLENLLNTAGYVGKFRKMVDGIVPTDQTFDAIENKINELVEVKIPGISVMFWKYNPLWEVLFSKSTKNKHFGYFIDNLCDVPEHHTYLPNKGFYISETIRENETEYIEDNIQSYDDYVSFENLFMTTALARKALSNNQWHLQYRYGLTTRKIFPQAVSSTPQLFIRWPLLAKIYNDTFWSPPNEFRGKNWDIADWRSLESEINAYEKLARASGVQLPPHHVFNRINSRYQQTICLH